MSFELIAMSQKLRAELHTGFGFEASPVCF